MSAVELGLVLVVTMIAATIQASIGFGFNIVAVPILTIINPALTPVPLILANLPFNLMTIGAERRSADVRGAALVLVGRIPGVAIGTWLLATAEDRVIDGLIALVVLAATAAFWRGAHIPRCTATQVGAGVMAGTTGTASAIGGPPVALLYYGERGPVVRGTLATIFTGGGVITITGLWLAGQISVEHIRLAGIVLPAMVIGWALSRLVIPYVNEAHLRRGTQLVAAAAGLVLGLKTLLG